MREVTLLRKGRGVTVKFNEAKINLTKKLQIQNHYLLALLHFIPICSQCRRTSLRPQKGKNLHLAETPFYFFFRKPVLKLSYRFWAICFDVFKRSDKFKGFVTSGLKKYRKTSTKREIHEKACKETGQEGKNPAICVQKWRCVYFIALFLVTKEMHGKRLTFKCQNGVEHKLPPIVNHIMFVD